KRFAVCSVCSSVTPTMSSSTVQAASSCRRRCASTRRSINVSCWWDRATSSSSGTKRSGSTKRRRPSLSPRADYRPSSMAFRSDQGQMPDAGHVPVLLEEAVAALAIKAGGTYVDATFGRGGHGERILAALGPAGRLVAIDRDPAAEAAARDWRDRRFTFHRAWFSDVAHVLDGEGIGMADGVLLDFGLASPQIDEPARGVSRRADRPLDMAMGPSRGG